MLKKHQELNKSTGSMKSNNPQQASRQQPRVVRHQIAIERDDDEDDAVLAAAADMNQQNKPSLPFVGVPVPPEY